MPADPRPYTFDRVVRLLFSAGLLILFIWGLGFLSDVLVPFVVAFLLAYLVNPLVSVIQRRVPQRAAAVLLGLLLVLAALLLLAWMVIPLIVVEIARMGQILTAFTTDSGLGKRAAEILPPDLWQRIKELVLRPEVRELFQAENVWKVAEAALRKVLPGVWGMITGAASLAMGLVGLAVIGLYMVFLLLEYPQVSGNWKDLVPPAYRETVVSFLSDFESAMSRYFRGQALVAAICGGLYAIGFMLVGLPLGILLGLFLGLLAMVPYLTLLGVIPAVLLSLFHALETGGSIWLVLGLSGTVFAVVQAVQDWILVPRIMGKVTGLNPAMIMLSLSVWGKLLGFLGLIIALPMTCLGLVYYRRFLASAQRLPPTPDRERV